MYNFEWDSAKEKINIEKHGVGFSEAAQVFGDLNYLIRFDRNTDGEDRWHAIGRVEGAILLVVHCYRMIQQNGEETIRIISARAANKKERQQYLQQTA